MAILSAHFGPVVITATTAAQTFNNARWSTGGTSRLADVTTSATTGSQYLGIINDPTWEIDAPEDTTQYPESYLSSGLSLTKVWFGRGASGLGERIPLTTVESVDYVNANGQDAVRVVIRGRGGFITSAVSN